MVVWASIPWFGHIQYIAHWCQSWEFRCLELQDDVWRDPLIPPPDVWQGQHNDFMEELKIRKARLEKQKARLSD